MRRKQFLMVTKMILWKDRLILLKKELNENNHSRDQLMNLKRKDTRNVMVENNLLNKVISQLQATTAVELMIGHRMINVQQQVLLHLPRDLVPMLRLQAEILGMSKKKLLLRWKQLLIVEGRDTIVFLLLWHLNVKNHHQKQLLEVLNVPLKKGLRSLRLTLRVIDQL